MSLRQAAQQALEALNRLYNDSEIMVTHDQHRDMKAAITALRAALAEPEQEPVAHTLNCVCGAVWDIKTDGSEEMVHTPDPSPPKRKPLTHPQIHELDWPDGVPFEDILLFARAIERAHGIGEQHGS